jgi:hypothetical protein
VTDFSVAVRTRAGVPVNLPGGLQLDVLRFGANVDGGYESAEIEARGPELVLHKLRGWLRYGVEIHGPGGLAWAGRVEEISLRLGNVSVSVSSENLFNAINVIYSYTGDDGGSETGLTGWLVDNHSANEYGRKDALHSAGGEITKEAAEIMRQTVLNACAKASGISVSVDGASGEYAATLYCKGLFASLDDRYYEDAAGYEAHEETGGGRVLLGWAYTANSIGFVSAPNNRILDFAGKLIALDEGDQVKVSGSTGNNGAKVVANPVEGETQTYTASTISFDPSDDIKDSAGGLGFVRAKEGVRVTGSPNNDGYYFTTDVVSGAGIEVSSYGAAPIQSDSAGPAVTLQMAHNIETETALANEIPGATVTLTAYGQMTSQGFQVVNGPWMAGEVAISIARHGSPTDDIVVEIRNDASGLPGAVIASGILEWENIPAQTEGWRSVQMVTPVQLVNGTQYWVNVKRLGAAHVDNYYTLALDTDAAYTRGDLRLWDGAAWQTRGTDAHMPFKAWGVMDSTQKMAEIVQAVGGPVTQVFAPVLAGVRTRKIRDGRTTAGEEMRQLLGMGNSSGQRIIATMTPAAALVIDYETAAEASPLLWRKDGTLRRSDGGRLPPGSLPVGRWVQVEQLLAGDWQARDALFLVGSAEYDTRNNTWSLRPIEARDPFDIGAVNA